VTTFTDTVAGEIVTLIFVTGSVQVDVVVVEDDVEVVVVQVTAVLAGAAPQEDRPKIAQKAKTKIRRRFTAPRSSLIEIPGACDCVSTMIPRT
jgi:hypothetical protein